MSGEGVGTDYQPAKAKKKWGQKPNNWIRSATLLFVILYTAITYCLLRFNQQTTIGDQRAWLAPLGIEFEVGQADPDAVGKPVAFVIHYENTGKSPALDFGDNETFSYIDAKAFTPVVQPKPGGLVEQITSPVEMTALGKSNPACGKVHPIDGGLAIFPTVMPPALHRSRPLQTHPRSIIAGDATLIIYGCFAYRSFSEIRITAFCYYAERTPDREFKYWPLKPCPNGGNYAE